MEKHIRNQAIAEAHEGGEPVAALASRFNLTPASVKRILKDFDFYIRLRSERSLPDGISLVTAVTVEQAVGIWPELSNLDEVLNRRIDLLRSPAHGKLVRIALAEITQAKALR
ncbi:hypothetical protein [Agrobacterium tumefaciens]|uniref:hypothetical protein n=1 Tax=Agrobacterium tumefaciens TaxID=358 RepID=UPI002242FD4A|nr:hypothetical protein [Agrobacterium tumefaciens]MCW8060157.1 hypothetical protein [Agrobacterium tumefaciens]